jgi:hypothetical protein
MSKGPRRQERKSLSSGNVCANFPGKSWRFSNPDEENRGGSENLADEK